MENREERARQTLAKNLDFIMQQKDLGVKQMAAALEVGTSMVSAVRAGRRQIPGIYPFFASLTRLSGFTVEELLSEDLRERDEKLEAHRQEDLSFYKGLYFMYYYNTRAVKGHESASEKKAVEYGLLGIYRNPENGLYEVIADFGLSRQEQQVRYDACTVRAKDAATVRKLKDDYVEILQRSFSGDSIYKGKVFLSTGHIFWQLSCGEKDRAFLIGHRPDGRSNSYIGGLCASVSVSRGREACPCLQMVGISRNMLMASEEEIGDQLSLGYPDIRPSEEQTREMCDIFDHLWNDPKNSFLTEDQKRDVLAGVSGRIIGSIVRDNLFRAIKVSRDDDDEFYHFIKRAGERGEKT